MRGRGQGSAHYMPRRARNRAALGVAGRTRGPVAAHILPLARGGRLEEAAEKSGERYPRNEGHGAIKAGERLLEGCKCLGATLIPSSPIAALMGEGFPSLGGKPGFPSLAPIRRLPNPHPHVLQTQRGGGNASSPLSPQRQASLAPSICRSCGPPAHRSNSSVPHRLVPMAPQCQADRVWGPDSEIGGLCDL